MQDGHANISGIRKAIAEAKAVTDKPTLIKVAGVLASGRVRMHACMCAHASMRSCKAPWDSAGQVRGHLCKPTPCLQASERRTVSPRLRQECSLSTPQTGLRLLQASDRQSLAHC